MLRLVLCVALLLGLPHLALGSTPWGPPDGTYAYTIEHSEHGKLGTQTITIATDGETRHVSDDRRLKVERLFVTVYREDTRIEEFWQGTDMQSYSRVSDYGDEVTRLTATRQGDHLVIDNDGKTSELPADTLSTHLWNPLLVEQTRLFSTEDGSLLKVAFARAGEEDVVVGGQRLKANRFEMTGDERRTFWFDDQGRLLKMQLHRGGDEIVTFQLKALPG